MVEIENIRSILVEIIEKSLKDAEHPETFQSNSVRIIENLFPNFDKMNRVPEYVDVSTVYSIIDEFEDCVSHYCPYVNDFKELLLITLVYLKRNERIDDPGLDAFFCRKNR